MKWVKIILLFQAVITLIIGVVFFSQVLSLDEAQIEELKIEMSKGYNFWDSDAPKVLIDLKQRYTVAAYVLVVIAILEILIISRIFRQEKSTNF